MPLAHPPGHAPVDFGEAVAVIGGVRQKLHFFCMDLPQSDACFGKLEGQIDFAVQAKRWVVERLFAWIHRNRSLAKDVEATIASAEAFFYGASAILLQRRLAC